MKKNTNGKILPIDEIDLHIAQGKLAVLSKQNFTSILAGNIMAPVGVSLVLYFSDYPINTLMIWLGFSLLLGIARLLHHREFIHFQEYGKPMKQWEFEQILLAMLSGLSWSAAAILFVTVDNTTISVFVTVSVLALISGATSAYSSHPRIFSAFSLSLWLPAALYYIIQNNSFYYQLTFLGSLFLSWNIATVLSQSRSITETIKLQSENTKLLYELKYQRLIAEEANKAKSRFLAAASHDLRQPLHAMGLFADGLNHRIANPEAMRVLGLLKGSMETLRNLFDSLLDISRLDAGVIKVDAQTFSLNQMLERLNIEYEALTKAKSLKFRSRLIPSWIHSDPTLVEQMLRNLIANAIKYTESGGILVAIRPKSNKIRIEVWDTGIGIAKENQKQIFDEFNQVNNPERDRSQGIGLGLSILKRTAGLLGTEIGMSSKLGSGSKFHIDFFPTDAPSFIDDHFTNSQIVEKDLDLDLTGVSVLVVDDEADIRAALELRLQDWGCNVATAYSIKSACNLLNDFTPDILLTDYRLSANETGDMVIKEVHKTIGYEIPSIIVTGTTMAEYIQNIEQLNVSVLYKPLEPKALQEKMIYALNKAH